MTARLASDCYQVGGKAWGPAHMSSLLGKLYQHRPEALYPGQHCKRMNLVRGLEEDHGQATAVVRIDIHSGYYQYTCQALALLISSSVG